MYNKAKSRALKIERLTVASARLAASMSSFRESFSGWSAAHFSILLALWSNLAAKCSRRCNLCSWGRISFKTCSLSCRQPQGDPLPYEVLLSLSISTNTHTFALPFLPTLVILLLSSLFSLTLNLYTPPYSTSCKYTHTHTHTHTQYYAHNVNGTYTYTCKHRQTLTSSVRSSDTPVSLSRRPRVPSRPR